MADYPPTPSYGVGYGLAHGAPNFHRAQPARLGTLQPADAGLVLQDQQNRYAYEYNNASVSGSAAVEQGGWYGSAAKGQLLHGQTQNRAKRDSVYASHDPQVPPGLKEFSSNLSGMEVSDGRGVPNDVRPQSDGNHIRHQYERGSHQEPVRQDFRGSLNGNDASHLYGSRQSPSAITAGPATSRRDSIYDSLESGDDTGFAEYYRTDEERERIKSTSPVIKTSSKAPEEVPLPIVSTEPARLSAPTKTLGEARRDAQNAVLNLLPAKIRFSHYIEEGFEESFIRKLFEDLRLPISSETLHSGDSTTNQSEMAAPVKGPAHGVIEENTLPDSVDAAEPASGTGEERKDRIARLLAEKKRKQEEAALAQAAIKAEKKKLLQQKLEALEKSRLKNTPPAPTATVSHELAPELAPHQPSESNTTSPRHQTPPVETRNASVTPIPGLNLSNGSAMASASSQRKRPVAADFDEAASLPLKRPFGQSRSESQYVIDVSESEDDEVAAPANKQVEIPTAPLALRAPSAPRGHGRANPHDLKKRELAILDMKRRIAVLELKKRAKENSRPASNSADQTPASMPSSLDISLEVDRLVEDAALQADSRSKLAEVAADKATIARLEREVAETSQSDIDASIRLLDAAVEDGRRKLFELKVEVERCEARIRQTLNERQALMDERLRRETQSENTSSEESEEAGKSLPSPVSDIGRVIDKKPTPRTAIVDEQSAEAGRSPSSAAMQVSSSDSQASTDETSAAELANGQVDPSETATTGTEAAPLGRSDSEKLTAPLPTDSEQRADSDVGMDDSYSPQADSESSNDSTSVDESDSESDGEDDVEMVDSDGYEPPEATEPAEISSPFSPAPAEEVAESNPSLQDPESSLPELTDQPALGDSEDLAQHGVSGDVDNSSPTFFTTYESPLKYFRSYRFHPDYEKMVAGGFKSLTYSNKIAPNEELCRYELAGGKCNDTECEFQHFKDMSLDENIILVELGNSAVYDEADRPKFVTGLKDVLYQAKVNNIKDFRSIAAEIAAFRGRFLGDPSRVVSVDKTITL